MNNSSRISAGSTVWLVALVLAAVTGSLMLSCLAPFAALAIALAGTVRLRVALLAIAIVWLANQFVGFAFYHFPRTPNTLLWGAAGGVAALLSVLAALFCLQCARRWPALVRLGVALVVSYAAYEFALFVSALCLGGLKDFSPAVIAQIGFVNVVWFVGLIALNELLAINWRVPRLISASA